MTGTKRALLIASTYKDLKGPLNDVKSMASVLEKWGFQIATCCGKDASYQGILDAWKKIIDETQSSEDTVLIYYAGHGGLVEDTANVSESSPNASDPSTAARYQFIVPVDYLADASSDTKHPDVGTARLFNGILDIEISHLLNSTTQRTRNVTTIFDCCHSGSMVRDPLRPDQARVRSVGKVRHRDIAERVATLRRTRAIPSSNDELNADGNTSAVRIAATLSSFSAWESPDRSDNWTGTMTRALVLALMNAFKEAGKNPDSAEMISWKTLVAFVREQVQIDFPQQHAHVDGPSTRRIFSLKESQSKSFVLQMEDKEAILKAGSVSGVHAGNVYGLMPHGSEQLIKAKQLGKATVLNVLGLDSRTKLELFNKDIRIPKGGVLAFLEDEAFPRWPVAVPQGQEMLRDSIQKSKYIYTQSEGNEENAIAKFWVDGDSLGLSTKSSVKLMRQKTSDNVLTAQACDELVRAAEGLARAQHLLALAPRAGGEMLDHAVTLTIGKVNNGKPSHIVDTDKGGVVTDADRIFILLHNEEKTSRFASIFAVDIYGTISCVHSKNASSIELHAEQTTAVGVGMWDTGSFAKYQKGSEWPPGSTAQGIPISWPAGIDKNQPVKDDLIVILTEKRVDLGCLTSEESTTSRGPDASSLELLALEIGSGTRRTIGTATEKPNPFAIIQTPLRVESRKFGIEELPSPENVTEFEGFNNEPLPDTKEERGLFAGMFRTAKGTPPYVWVVNDHSEDIQVVVSKYRPNRLLSGGGIDASPAGAGLNLDTTTFFSPACKKTLPGKKQGEDPSTGRFPLWTRKEGFGVISILKGGDPDWHLYIENDQIPIGVTAHFTGKPNLTFVEWEKAENTSYPACYGPARHGTLLFNCSGNVTRVTINNPPINLVNSVLINDLWDFLGALQPTRNVTNPLPNGPTPKLVIFDSNNPGFFLSHVDANNLLPPLTLAKLDSMTKFGEIVRMLQNITTTAFIAETNGRSAGGGLELMVQMDMRFAGPKAHSSFMENGLGIFPAVGGQLFLPMLTNKARALEHLLAVKAFDAPTGTGLGLFNNDYTTAEELRKEVDLLAARISVFPQASLGETKGRLNYWNPSLDVQVSDLNTLQEFIQNPAVQPPIARALEASKNQSRSEWELGLPNSIFEGVWAWKHRLD